MTKKNLKTYLLTSAALLALAACGQSEDKKEAESSSSQETSVSKEAASSSSSAEEKKTEVSLKDWEGVWNNMVSYYKEPELQEDIAELAEKEGVTSEEYIEQAKKDSVPFASITIKGDDSTIAFADSRDGEGQPVKYAYDGEESFDHGGLPMSWYVFKAEDEGADYPYILLMKLHGEEELAHFHLRAGNTVDEAMADEEWYPTFVAQDTKIGLIQEELVEHEEEHAGGHHHDEGHEHDESAAH